MRPKESKLKGLCRENKRNLQKYEGYNCIFQLQKQKVESFFGENDQCNPTFFIILNPNLIEF